MSTVLPPFASAGQGIQRTLLEGDSVRSSLDLPNVIAEVSASAAQWNFRIDELLAHLDVVAGTIDYLAPWETRVQLRRALKQKGRALQQAKRDLTSQVRMLSCFAGGLDA
jgi:hypothetical protein